MDYASTLQWMYARLPMYQRLGAAALNPDLTRITALADYLGNPQQGFKSIHIAGTNGKGSSAHMTAAVLQTAGYKVGLYTSPHLKHFSERIRIDGKPIPSDFVVAFVAAHKSFLEANSCSFFEMTVAMAFAFFAAQEVDVAVIEVGLGGRLDATNIIQPEGCLITNISLDHQQFLGSTLTEIAKEKAGIIKPQTPVIISEYQSEIHTVFEEVAIQKQAPIYQAPATSFKTDLTGDYQQQNASGVVALLGQLPSFAVDKTHMQKGLMHVRTLTGLRGRWELLGNNPTTIADVAHNKEGLERVMAQLEKQQYTQLHIVFGMVNDKDANSIVNLLPREATYYVCAASVPRVMPVAQLAKIFRAVGLVHSSNSSVSAAYAAAREAAAPDDFIFIGGSLFVVAEVLP